MSPSCNSYEEVEKYILGIPRFTSKNGLEDTRCYLDVLGNPGEDRKIIHVAGTNGKGSVCAYLCSVLMEAGYSVGMFTSPHLVDMRERFRVKGIPVTQERFVRAFDRVMEHLGEAQKRTGKEAYHPTFFELLFLMGMVIFQEEDTEYILLETGLGGRLDATNVVKNPVVTVITEIGLDHMKYLGDTVSQIAEEKAGIIKPGVPVVFCDKRIEASQVIQKRAEILENRVVAVSEKDCINRNLTNKSIDFSMYSRYYDYIRLNLRTKALYQIENAALAIRAIEELPDAPDISREQIETGISRAHWEGRMEEILPDVYVDGAHNEDGIRAFIQTVEADGCRGKRYLLFSAVTDKNYEGMIQILGERKLFDRTAVLRLQEERAADPAVLKRLFDRTFEKAGNMPPEGCIIYGGVEEALDGLTTEKENADYLYIVGSLYLAGEIKAVLRRRMDD